MKENNKISYEKPSLNFISIELENNMLDCCSVQTIQYSVTVDESVNFDSVELEYNDDYY